MKKNYFDPSQTKDILGRTHDEDFGFTTHDDESCGHTDIIVGLTVDMDVIVNG